MYFLQQFEPKVMISARVNLKRVMGSSTPERTVSFYAVQNAATHIFWNGNTDSVKDDAVKHKPVPASPCTKSRGKIRKLWNKHWVICHMNTKPCDNCTHILPPHIAGQTISMLGKQRNIWIPGTIHCKLQHKSYLVKTTDGSLYHHTQTSV